MSLRRIGPFVLIMLVGVFACVFAIQQQHSATNVLVAQMQSLKQESAEQALDHWQRRVRFFLERAVQDETLLNQLGSGQQSGRRISAENECWRLETMGKEDDKD